MLSRRQYIFIALKISLLFSSFAKTVTLQEKKFELSLRATATTSKLIRIATPGNRIPIKSILADGAKVQKGDIICEFDISDVKYKLQLEILKKKIIEADLATELIALDKTDSKDKLALLFDQKKVKKASLKRLQSLPLKEDIILAEGQYKLAQLELDAVQKDFVKAQELFQKKLSSNAELYKAEQDLKVQEINLNYAKNSLDYSKLPASSSSLKKLKIEIKNLDLEISKLQNEIKENSALIDVHKTKATNRLKVNERKINELKSNIDSVQLKAPKDGYINYAKTYKALAVGERFPANYNILEIPDLSSLAFKALLPERTRSYFSVGDPVKAYVNGQRNTALTGKISHIDRIAIDREAAKESTWGAKDKSSGIKVYIIKVTLDEACNDVRPGMHAKLVLKATKAIKGASVNISYIKQKEERYYASINGLYQEVKGQVIGDSFFFSDDSLLGKELSLYGQFPTQVERQSNNNFKGFFKATGELKPSKSTPITIPKGGRWLSVKWLVPEDSLVTKGQHIATFESDDLKDSINSTEDELSTLRAKSKEINTKLKLQKRESKFQVSSKENLAEIAQINKKITLTSIDYEAYLRAHKTRETAKISLERLNEKYRRLLKVAPQFVTAKETRKLKREIRQAELGLEKAEIDFKLVNDGEDQLSKRKAELEAFEAQNDFLIAKREAKFNIYKQEMTLKETKLKEVKSQIDLDRYLKRKKQLKLHSPSAGILRYEKAYVGGAIAKIEVGSRVPDRSRIMSIPDLSKVSVIVEVPEHFYPKIKKGMSVKVRLPAITQDSLSAKVISIDYFFELKEKKESQLGLYSSHEPLGETVFKVQIQLDHTPKNLKSNVQAEVYFPFDTESAK